MSIHAVVTDTDWDFFLEVHWRAQGESVDFSPEVGPWIRTLGNAEVSSEIRRHHRVSAWVLKRDCIPVLRWILWSEISHPETLYIDVLSGIESELTPPIWKEFTTWLDEWKRSHQYTKLIPRTLLPWFEVPLLPSSEIFEVKSDHPSILSFRAKIEKSRLLSEITFSNLDWSVLPKIYQPWKSWLSVLIENSLCFMAMRKGKPIGFIIGIPHYNKPGEPSSQEFYRGHAHFFWKVKARVLSFFLSKKVKSAKILWIAENKSDEDLGVSIILLNEFLRRSFERGMKSVQTPLISQDQYVLNAALKELGAIPQKHSSHFSRLFT